MSFPSGDEPCRVAYPFSTRAGVGCCYIKAVRIETTVLIEEPRSPSGGRRLAFRPTLLGGPSPQPNLAIRRSAVPITAVHQSARIPEPGIGQLNIACSSC